MPKAKPPRKANRLHSGEKSRLALCVYGHPELDEVEGDVFQLDFFEDVYTLQKTKGLSPENAFAVLASALQPMLRLALAWIADPNRQSIEDRHAALAFLMENSESQPSQYEYRLNDKFDETGSVGYPLYYWRNPRVFESIAVPIARFIFERLELFHDGQIELDEAIPVVLCRREGCGNFTVARRRTKDFCSDSCRSRHRQKENAEDYAAYMRKYRRNTYMKPVQRARSKRLKSAR